MKQKKHTVNERIALLEKMCYKYAKEYHTKQLILHGVIVSDFCECDGVQDLHAMTGECRKCGKECDY